MNPDHIRNIIIALKEDKSCAQPYRNYAIKELEVAIALVEQGHRVTNLKPPAGMKIEPTTGLQPTSAATPTRTLECTCPDPDEMVDKTCPVHGGFSQ